MDRCEDLTAEINSLENEIGELIAEIAPTLLLAMGCGTLTAAKIVGETADVRRFRSKDAYARYGGTAPCPCGHPTIPATGSAGSGPASSTTPYTATPSPKPTGTQTPGPTRSAAKSPDTQTNKPSEPSSADSPISSTALFSLTPTSRQQPSRARQ